MKEISFNIINCPFEKERLTEIEFFRMKDIIHEDIHFSTSAFSYASVSDQIIIRGNWLSCGQLYYFLDNALL